MNTDGEGLPSAGEGYTLTAERLEDTSVQLNGKTLQLDPGGELPPLTVQMLPPKPWCQRKCSSVKP